MKSANSMANCSEPDVPALGLQLPGDVGVSSSGSAGMLGQRPAEDDAGEGAGAAQQVVLGQERAHAVTEQDHRLPGVGLADRWAVRRWASSTMWPQPFASMMPKRSSVPAVLPWARWSLAYTA